VYLLYLDESGNPEDWTQNRFFVLAGVAVFEGEIRRLTQEVDALQHRFLPNLANPIELHAEHIYKGKGRWRNEDPRVRNQLMEAVYATISQQVYPGMVLFGAAVHDSAPQSGGADALHLAFEEVCGRFNQFLVRMAHHGADPEKGLLIVDQSGRDRRYRELADFFRHQGIRLGYLGNVVDIPYFTQSQHTRMLQIADFVAYAVFQYYERNLQDFLNLVLERFDWPGRASRRRPVGLCHLTRQPAPHACRCAATHTHLR
jgi:hypothetical protein